MRAGTGQIGAAPTPNDYTSVIFENHVVRGCHDPLTLR